jgi:dephospho-CoA kinase
MVIVIVVGMPGSGKDVLLQSAIALGFGHIRMGDVVRNHAAKFELGVSDESIGGFASSERQKHGAAIWAERTLESMPKGNAIIDGSRSLDEINFFRNRLGDDLKVIAVHAPQETRFRRLQNRRRDDDPESLDDLIRRDNREMAWGLGRAIDTADIAIDNDAGLDEFRMRCQAILKSLLDGHGKSI